MVQAQRAKIQELLAAEQSPLRDELLRLGFDALATVPLASLSSAAALAELVCAALTRENVEHMAVRHVLPAAERISAALSGAPEVLRDALSPAAESRLRAIVASGQGPRFGWLKGAIDPEDFRQLLAPVVQQVLVQFTAKLPLPGLTGAPSGSLGGLVGRLGKQVQKSAGQLADVGKSMMSGIGGELERRMQIVARDFSQTATSEFRLALLDRLRSAEGKAIVARIRDRVLEYALAAKFEDVAVDFMRLPASDIGAFAAELMGGLPERPLFRRVLQLEIEGVFAELEQRSLADILAEAGILDAARLQIAAAVEPGLKRLVQSQAFGLWLERLLSESAIS
jgi:hypothetical protein